MTSHRRTLALAGALSASLAAGAAWAADNKVVIGDIDDMSGPYADVIGASGVEFDQNGHRRFWRIGAWPADSNSDLRSSKQAGSSPGKSFANGLTQLA